MSQPTPAGLWVKRTDGARLGPIIGLCFGSFRLRGPGPVSWAGPNPTGTRQGVWILERHKRGDYGLSNVRAVGSRV